MATMMVGTQEVQKIMYGTEELTTLAIGDWSFPVGGADYSKMPLTIEIVSGGSLTITQADINYKINDGEWQKTTGRQVLYNLQVGDTIQFLAGYGARNALFSNSKSARFNVYGNIMSLLYEDNFEGQTVMPASAFQQTFAMGYVLDASNLILPDSTSNSCFGTMFWNDTLLTAGPKLPSTTELSNYCYRSMFDGCSSLTSNFELPATTIKTSSYQNMFQGCTSLTTAPALPGTTLAPYCYQGMFNGCTGLTISPELPATTLAQSCYDSLFNGCSNLNYIKCLATNISAINCLNNWVNGVAANGTFVKDANMSSWTTGASGIPDGWTVENA